MRKIFLVRHGYIVNPQGIIYGRLPGFPLSEEGRKQMVNVAKVFRDKNIRRIITSPMLRTTQSANIIRKELGDVPIIKDKRLIELKTNLQGEKESMTRYVYHPQYQKPGDETEEQMASRMMSVVNEYYEKNQGNTILVSHGDPLYFLTQALQNKTPMDPYKSNHANYPQKGSVIEVSKSKDKWNLQRLI